MYFQVKNDADSSKQNALHHYQWGNGCDGWVLVDTHTLSVKQGTDARRYSGSFTLS